MTKPEAQASPLPWELIASTENHGPYIVNAAGSDVCDFYAMSNPMSLSVRNGGDSKPVKFMDADENAAFVLEAVNSHASLKQRVEELEAAMKGAAVIANIAGARIGDLERALKPFSDCAGMCSGNDDDGLSIELRHPDYHRSTSITVGDLRAARRALSPRGET